MDTLAPKEWGEDISLSSSIPIIKGGGGDEWPEAAAETQQGTILYPAEVHSPLPILILHEALQTRLPTAVHKSG